MMRKRTLLILAAAVLVLIIARGIYPKQVATSKKPIAVCGKMN